MAQAKPKAKQAGNDPAPPKQKVNVADAVSGFFEKTGGAVVVGTMVGASGFGAAALLFLH